MKKIYEGIARIIRWMVTGMISFIIGLPAWVSYTAEI